MKKNEQFLFVHIPKTAGTSFRKSSETYFGTNNTFYDYGESVKDTSSLIKQLVYKQNDSYALYLKLCSKPKNILSGHFPITKYLSIYNLKNIICFVREPAQQIRSHFEHFAHYHGYKKSFIEFIQEPRFINFQSKHLRGVSLPSIGFVGLTEFYHDSVVLLNKEFGFSVPVSHMNRNKTKVSDSYELSVEENKLIADLNREDFELYESAKSLFERRVGCFDDALDFYRGELTLQALPKLQKGKFIHGWLMNFASDKAAKGYVLVNDDLRVGIVAKDYRPWVNERIGHRKGFVGFHEKLPFELKLGDTLKLFDENDLLVSTHVFKD